MNHHAALIRNLFAQSFPFYFCLSGFMCYSIEWDGYAVPTPSSEATQCSCGNQTARNKTQHPFPKGKLLRILCRLYVHVIYLSVCLYVFLSVHLSLDLQYLHLAQWGYGNQKARNGAFNLLSKGKSLVEMSTCNGLNSWLVMKTSWVQSLAH